MRYAELSPVSVRDVLLRQIRSASRALRKQETLTDETVHQARKKLKRARASLRLLRDAIGKSVYARENGGLRDAARPLGAVRDAKVALEALENLLVHEKKARCRAVLLKLRRVLQETRLSLHREVQRAGNLEASARSVEEAARRVEKWRVPGHGPAALHASIDRIYRKGRKALAQVESDCSNENLHEARKQAKYIGQAMEIFESFKACHLAKRIRRAESIANCLGEDHDLAILQDRIAKLSVGSHAAYKDLLAPIEHRRKKLQWKALKQGRRLYKSKAQTFIERLKTQA
jgi:CHAD domain-containing protein